MAQQKTIASSAKNGTEPPAIPAASDSALSRRSLDDMNKPKHDHYRQWNPKEPEYNGHRGSFPLDRLDVDLTE